MPCISGKVSLAEGRARAARAHQERALALDPEHSEAMNELGRIRLRRLGLGSAARYFLGAARAAPREGVYGRNVNVAVRLAVTLPVYVGTLAALALYIVTIAARLTRGQVLIGLAATAVLMSAAGAVPYQRMPSPTRALVRRRRNLLALGVTCGVLLAAFVIVAVSSAGSLLNAVACAAALMLAARFAVWGILRRKRD